MRQAVIVPKSHYESIFDIPENELQNVMAVVKKLVKVFNSKLGIQNVQIINSSGSEAQQDVFHFHVHLVPREQGDNQDIQWVTHPEWVDKFDRLLERLESEGKD